MPLCVLFPGCGGIKIMHRVHEVISRIHCREGYARCVCPLTSHCVVQGFGNIYGLVGHAFQNFVEAVQGEG